MKSPRPWIIVALFVAIFIAALFADIPVAAWAHNEPITRYGLSIAAWLKYHEVGLEVFRIRVPYFGLKIIRLPGIAEIIRLPGNFLYTVIACAVLIWIARKQSIRWGRELWEKPAIVLLAGVFSGVNAFLKLCIGRIRPYHGVPPFELHPFSRSPIEAEAGFSFPSGDASLAFAMAVSLSIVAPKWWPLWWALAIIVGVERICENAHYPSDVVAGAALGTGIAILAKKIVQGWGKSVTTSPAGDI